MSASHPTGLGDPEPIGKQALFRPPAKKHLKPAAKKPTDTSPGKTSQSKAPLPSNSPRQTPKRVRITTELTGRAMGIILAIQNRHRLQTGKALPQWKVVNEAIEYFGAAKGIDP